MTIVQWLRFGSQTSLRVIGSSPRDGWTTVMLLAGRPTAMALTGR